MLPAKFAGLEAALTSAIKQTLIDSPPDPLAHLGMLLIAASKAKAVPAADLEALTASPPVHAVHGPGDEDLPESLRLSGPPVAARAVSEVQRSLSDPKTRVAVFGGSFNPVTNAHLNCAAEIIHSKLADEVWLVPCGARPDKSSLKTSYLHRMIMCHLAVDTTFGSRFGVRVSSEESTVPRAMPTIVMMRRLVAKHACCDFKFVVGYPPDHHLTTLS
jgi:hypothetical protein